jgi:hypothetical protein
MTGFPFQETYLLYLLTYFVGLGVGLLIAVLIGYGLSNYLGREDEFRD